MKITSVMIVAALAAAAAPAAALTTVTIDFSGDICGASGTGTCNNNAQIAADLGSTPEVAVSYQQVVGTTVTADFLKYWGPDYSDLTGVAWSGTGAAASSRVILTPISGFEVQLLSFDAGCFLNRVSCQNIPWLARTGSETLASGTSTPGLLADSVTVNSGFVTGPLTLDFGPDGFNGGLDNIVFQIRAASDDVNIVPEPQSWAMLIAGFGLVGAAMRRRRRALA